MRLRKLSRKRTGIECVEVAITLPLLVIAMFSTINITHRWHVEKLLKIASYEAIKAGCARDGNSSDADRVFREHAEALGINRARLVYNRNRLDNAKTGQMIQVRALAPARFNQIMAPIQLNFSPTLSGGSIFYRKEGL